MPFTRISSMVRKPSSTLLVHGCASCYYDQQWLWYKRVTPIPADLDLWWQLQYGRYQAGVAGNRYAVDFLIYGSYEDALNDEKPGIVQNATSEMVSLAIAPRIGPHETLKAAFSVKVPQDLTSSGSPKTRGVRCSTLSQRQRLMPCREVLALSPVWLRQLLEKSAFLARPTRKTAAMPCSSQLRARLVNI